jgi:hypothetical protein
LRGINDFDSLSEFNGAIEVGQADASKKIGLLALEFIGLDSSTL